MGTTEMSVTPLTRPRHKISDRDIINVPGHNICFKDTTDISGIPNVCQGQYIHIKVINHVSGIPQM